MCPLGYLLFTLSSVTFWFCWSVTDDSLLLVLTNAANCQFLYELLAAVFCIQVELEKVKKRRIEREKEREDRENERVWLDHFLANLSVSVVYCVLLTS